MSTKVTMSHSKDPDYHFYKECFDGDNVYLDLRGKTAYFEASHNSVMVKIPIDVWNEIIKHGAMEKGKICREWDEAMDVKEAK